MKQLIQFIFPTIKAVATVTGFMIGIGWGAYAAIELVAKSQAQVVENKMMAVRNVDFQYISARFDRQEQKLDKIIEMIEENK